MDNKITKIICQNCKKDFFIEPDDFKFYEKIKVPAPTFCPECRLQRRFSWRNERTLYKRNCDLCGKSIIAVFSLDKPTPVYCHDCWWSDRWDAVVYGKMNNFNQPLLAQFQKLILQVPLPNLTAINNTNSNYINLGRDNKNCYFSVSPIKCEDSAYIYRADDSSFCFDSSFLANCESCYEIIDTNTCNHVFFSRYAENCIDSHFLFDCRNCQNCFGCVNLINKSYQILNKQYSKEEYTKIISEIKGNYFKLSKFKKEFFEFIKKYPHRYANLHNTSNVIGDNMMNFRNGYYCFDGTKTTTGENCKYIIGSIGQTTDSYDVSYPIKPNFCYEIQSGEPSFSAFINRSNNIHHCQYTQHCYSSHDLFACIGLRSKQYCILNKQYTKEEYEALVPKIIKHMNDMPYIDKKGRIYRYGEFFPSELSPFCYNETIAQEYFPLTKEEATEQGYKWKEKEERNYNIDIKTKDIPNDIKEVNESIINKVIECEHQGKCNEQCTEAFKIIPDELSFYKRMNLPIPHFCPNCRHYNRLKQRNPLKLWHRKCMKPNCPNEFETSYAPDRPEIVYCEKCYQQEVY